MADAVENGDIQENFVEDGIKVDVEATTINLDCVKSEPNEGTLDFEEDNHSTQYKITLKYEGIYGESSRQIKIEEDYDNLIGFLDNDVIMENAMIKLEAVKEEDDGSFNNFYCRKCKGIYKGYCLMCCTLLCILNKNTSIASFEAELNTIPTDILEIRTTSRGKGVYLLRAVPINVIFGPLGIESTIGHNWKIIDNKLKNIKSGNWMKNINCAASASLRNLDIFQIDGNLYFQSNREITEGEELLTYYDDEKLQQLDNTEECLYTPQKWEKLPKIFACTVCCLGFGSNKCLMEHKGKCCRMEYSRSMDEFVLIECNYCKMWMEKWEHEEYHVAYCLEKHHRTWNNYSEGVDRSGNDDETRCLNECGGGGLGERSNNEQTQNTIATNNSHHLHKNLNNHKGGGGSIKPFKCDICVMTFTQKSSLKKHIKNKHARDGSSKDYKCLECSYETNYKHDLKSHMKNKHAYNAKDYQCLECSYQTNYKGELQKHLNKHRGIKPFHCEICLMKFTRKCGLKLHIRNKHTGGVKDYKCSECSYATNRKSRFQTHLNKHTDDGVATNDKSNFQRHLIMHKGIKQFQCEICMMKFNHKSSLKKHIKNKHARDGSSKDYKCLECSYETNYKHDLKSHMKNKHAYNAKDYQCLECSFQTNYKAELQRHLNMHRGIKPFQCEICMMKFTRKCGLKLHIRNKHTDDGGVKDYKCSECSYATNRKSRFQTHLNMHKGIKQFQCEICMMKFTHKSSLKMHIKNKHTDHGGSAKDYKCSHCSYETNYKGHFQRHLIKHTDDGGMKDYKCSECSFQTNNKSDLHRHLNTHSGIKPFQCDTCMAKFNRNGSLTAHIKNKHAENEGVKDYKCSECCYQTNFKSDLRKHLNKHKGIKPFTCDISMKTFTLKDSLKKHIKDKHTDGGGVKDYKCSECSYATNRKSRFQTHLNNHKGIKPFQCEICMKTFTEKGNLTKHIKNKHANDKSVKD